MVIDDNEIDLYIARRVMTKYSFAEEIVTFSSAIEALDHLKATMDKGEALPEMIMLDINMPEMTGFQFLEKYGQMPENITNNCTIVMLSTSIHPEELNLANNSPHIQQFVNKPVSEETLKRLLATYHKQ